MKKALKLYHMLPPPLWNLLASYKAGVLKKRRYGKMFAEALPLIRERTFWERERWEAFQKQQLGEILNRASEAIPAYDGNPGCGAGDDPVEVLRRWPLMSTDHFRHNPSLYTDPACNMGEAVTLFTSGTTGTPKKIIRDPRAEQLNYAYSEARWKNLAGVSMEDRWVMVGGQLVVPVQRTKPPFWVHAYPMKQMYASSYHLTDDNAMHYMKAIEQWDPAYILGYASSLNRMAQFSEITGIKLKLKCVISNAEPLYAHIRDRVSRAFACRVYDTYGGTEGAFMAFECEAGRMHVSPDFGVVEILDNDGMPCGAEEQGKVVVTGLTNRAMPLIRYSTGDTAEWAVPEECACGCTFPVIKHIEGRTDDLIELPNGRLVGRLDPVFKAEFPIREAQIIQRKDLSIDVLVVKEEQHGGNSWSREHEAALMKELRARLGDDVPIKIGYCEKIPRSANNKFKAVVRER